MDVYELLKAVGGELVRGRARVRLGSTWVVFGEMIDGALALNDVGKKMAEEQAPAKPKRRVVRRKTPETEVESGNE